MTAQEFISQLQQRDAVIAELTQTVRQLTDQLAWCKRQLFGRKSERYEDPSQPRLFNIGGESSESNGSASSSESTDTQTITYQRQASTSRRGKRQPIPEDLRRELIVHDLPEQAKADPATGQTLLQKIGEEASERLAFKPGEMYVERHVRYKYRRVEENLSDDPLRGEIVTAPMPVEGLAKCIAAPSLLAQIAVSKYGDHLPLDRLVKIFKRHGVELSKASMCRWMQDIGELATPLLNLMKQRMIEHSRVIQHDDTPVRQQQPGSGTTKTCRFWTAVGQPGTAGHYVIFDYTQSREATGPQKWFTSGGDANGQPLFIGGQLQCDAYSGYTCKDGLLDPQGPWHMTHIGCWAHCRRKFHDARLNAPGQAAHALGLIRQLYDIEASIKDKPPQVRAQTRSTAATPWVDAFFDWCRQQQPACLPKSLIGEAIGYALNLQTPLRRYLSDGQLQIDNNSCERSLRGIAIGRKNWLFTGSPAGGLAAARLFSLIASAQLHRREPLAYLHHLIKYLPATPATQLDALLPDRWSPTPDTS